jgi:putative GTP pyrophosphokinase
MDLEAEYRARIQALTALKLAIVSELEEELAGDPFVERISGRVKSVDQFLKKATKQLNDGTAKYPEPLNEILKFDGERARVRDVVVRSFRQIEDRFKQPEEVDRFGYEATHLICLVPDDLRVETGSPIDFFEVQICTLFQHAWAECNHDVGYKAKEALTREEERLIAFAAASAWGADRFFEQLRQRPRPPNH